MDRGEGELPLLFEMRGGRETGRRRMFLRGRRGP